MIGNQVEVINFLLVQDKEKVFEIKDYKVKRSLDSNAYAWQLINKVGNKLHKSKEEVYLQMLKDYGQSEIIKIKNVVNPSDYFKYYEQVNEKDNYIYYKIFKGSSNFNSKEMSIFIDGIVETAKELDIETMTPNEIANLKSLWSNNE
jgi:hypothetical protein